ncbi:transglutaminase-like cysteine peptidase [Sphingomonas sp. CJ20]
MARTFGFLQSVALCGVLISQTPALAYSYTSGKSLVAPAAAERVALNWKQVPRWSDVMSRAQLERGAGNGCAAEAPAGSAACRYVIWQSEMQSLDGRAPREQIAAVQTAINRLPYVSDIENWSMTDRWATPAEMFAKGGDCEDYALAKYFALRELGFPEPDLTLAIVWDNQDSEQHAVLFVRSEGAVWLLDNKFDAPMPASAFAARYRVLYSLNQEGAHFSPAALGATRDNGPRLAAGGRMLVFKTRPVHRMAAAPVVQVAALSPNPAPAPASPMRAWKPRPVRPTR